MKVSSVQFLYQAHNIPLLDIIVFFEKLKALNLLSDINKSVDGWLYCNITK